MRRVKGRHRSGLNLRGAAVVCGALAAAVWMSVADAADWYVDAAAPASGTGDSRRAVWRRFADIDWSLLGAGDTLHIVGDRCGPAYAETLVVGAAGSEAAPLVVSGLSRSGAGAPLIDGRNRREFGVVLRERDHVTVRGLTIRNHAEAGISVRGARAGVLIENNEIFSGDPGGGNARGIDARRNVGASPLTVRANRYGTPVETAAQTDGIWSSDNDGAVFEGNLIVISNRSIEGHSDGIQSFLDKNITVRRNWFEQANTAIYNNHGAWMANTRNGGTIHFHDNIVLAPNLAGDAAVTHYRTSDWTENGTVEIRNNTIVGSARALNLANSPKAQVHNNIIVASTGGRAVVVLNAAPPPSNIDNNLMWSPSGPVAHVGGGNLSWSQWRARGYDAHGMNADPRLDPKSISGLRAPGKMMVGGRGASGLPSPLAGPASSACPVGR